MDIQRKQRYRQKINFVTEKIIDIPKKLQTDIEIDATLYRVQIAIEGCMDVVAMLVKDKGKDVSDDYNNIKGINDSGEVSLYLEKNPFDYYVLSLFNQEEYTPNALSTAPIIPFEESSSLFNEQTGLNRIYDNSYVFVFRSK